MKTIKLTEESWRILTMWKLEFQSKNLSEAIKSQENIHKAALNNIGELTNDKSKK